MKKEKLYWVKKVRKGHFVFPTCVYLGFPVLSCKNKSVKKAFIDLWGFKIWYLVFPTCVYWAFPVLSCWNLQKKLSLTCEEGGDARLRATILLLSLPKRRKAELPDMEFVKFTRRMQSSSWFQSLFLPFSCFRQFWTNVNPFRSPLTLLKTCSPFL